MFKYIRESFNTKDFKYGSYATIMTVIVLAIFIAVNVLVEQFNVKADLTENGLYSISEGTTLVLDKLTEDVNIYTIFETGQATASITEILDQYARRSNHIKIVNKDPYLSPQFTSKYSKDGEEIPISSIIVEKGNLYKVLLPSDLVTGQYDSYSGQFVVQSIDVEPRVTNAISYVLGSSSCNIYYTQGHNELEIMETIQKTMNDESMSFNEVNLMLDEMPDDIDILMSVAPQKDFTAEEIEKIKSFLSNNGRAIIFADVINNYRPNLDSLLSIYGVEYSNLQIVEGNPEYSLRNQVDIVPQIQPAEITQPLIEKRYYVLMPMAQGINEIGSTEKELQISPLLTTSADAYAKSELAQTIERESSDLPGPFNLAVSIADTQENGAKLVVIGASSVINDEYTNALVAGGNTDFVLNSIHWLLNDTDKITIRPKSISQEFLMINSSLQANIIILFSVLVFPLAIFIIGLVVWLRRKNR